MPKTKLKNDLEITGDLTVGGTVSVDGDSVASGTQVAKIADPAGGATTDAEARTAIGKIIDALEAFGISASA